MSMIDVVSGIDIGGRSTKIALVDNKGKILSHRVIPTLVNCDVEDHITLLAASIREEMKVLGSNYNLLGLGIGVPDANCITGTINHAHNLGWGDDVPFVKKMNLHFPGLHIELCNDANAAAVGEKEFGGAKSMDHFMVITLGTGVGSGIFVNGDLLIGSRGMAGELGHINAVPNGRVCGCGKLGCIEAYASATGIEKTALDFMANTRIESKLRDLPVRNISSKLIYEAALEKDEIALMTFEATGKYLGAALADFVCFSDPEAIFLFGGPVQAGEILMEPVRRHMNENLLHLFQGTVQLLPSELMGGDAAILGAAATIWNSIKKKN